MKFLSLTSVVLVTFALTPTGPSRAADDGPSTDRDLARLEREWGDAIVRRDAGALDRILADDYVLTTPYGQVVTKSQMIGSLRTPRGDAFELKGVEHGDLTARLYGNTAIVNSRFTLKGQAKGQDIVTPFRHTDVFVKQEGRWRCVSRQATLIMGPVAPAGASVARRD